MELSGVGAQTNWTAHPKQLFSGRIVAKRLFLSAKDFALEGNHQIGVNLTWSFENRFRLYLEKFWTSEARVPSSYTVRANGIPRISTVPSVLHLFFAGPDFVWDLLMLRLTPPKKYFFLHPRILNWSRHPAQPPARACAPPNQSISPTKKSYRAIDDH